VITKLAGSGTGGAGGFFGGRLARSGVDVSFIAKERRNVLAGGDRIEGGLGNLGRIGLVHAATCTDFARKAPGQQQRRRGISRAPRESHGP
jgi:ketopantoate reductase